MVADDTPERNGGLRPIPDPTTLTQDQIERAIKAEREWAQGQFDVIRQRIDGIDTATRLQFDRLGQFPSEIDEKVGHLGSLVDERFSSIRTQFAERDTRFERESRDNDVRVDAAFAAQKESAAKQDESNAKAIDKSERATEVAINKLQDLFNANALSLAASIADLKSRMDRIEGTKLGGTEQRTESRSSTQAIYAFIAVALTVAGYLAGK